MNSCRDDFNIAQEQQPASRPALKGVGRKQDTWLGFKEDVDSTMQWPVDVKNSSKETSAPKSKGELTERDSVPVTK